MLRDPGENVDNMQEDIGNFNNELEAVTRKQKGTKGMLEMENMISEMLNRNIGVNILILFLIWGKSIQSLTIKYKVKCRIGREGGRVFSDVFK